MSLCDIMSYYVFIHDKISYTAFFFYVKAYCAIYNYTYFTIYTITLFYVTLHVVIY